MSFLDEKVCFLDELVSVLFVNRSKLKVQAIFGNSCSFFMEPKKILISIIVFLMASIPSEKLYNY